MSVRHKIVLTNGAPTVGKTWLVNALYEWGSQFQGPTKRHPKKVKFADGIYKTVSTMFALPKDMNDESWREFKDRKWRTEENQNVFAMNGRDVLIHIGLLGRKLDPNMWINNLISHVIHEDSKSPRGFLWLNDDTGFSNEILSLQAHPDFDCLTVYIDDGDGHALASQIDGDYRQFVNDSRFDLSRHCTIRAPNSTAAFEQVKQALLSRGW